MLKRNLENDKCEGYNYKVTIDAVEGFTTEYKKEGNGTDNIITTITNTCKPVNPINPTNPGKTSPGTGNLENIASASVVILSLIGLAFIAITVKKRKSE